VASQKKKKASGTSESALGGSMVAGEKKQRRRLKPNPKERVKKAVQGRKKNCPYGGKGGNTTTSVHKRV